MPSWPLDPPITAYAPPDGETFIELRDPGNAMVSHPRPSWVSPIIAPTSSLTPVLAPEAGAIVYIGDGTEAPFAGNGPGVVVLASKRFLHVLGNLDALTLRAEGQVFSRWNDYTGGEHDRGIFKQGLVQYIFSDAPTYPRPKVAEGDVVGYVSPARGRLRWSMLSTLGVPVQPLGWADDNALPPPAMIWPTPAPAPAPAYEPPAPASDDSGLLIAAGAAAGVGILVALGKKRRHHQRRRTR